MSSTTSRLPFRGLVSAFVGALACVAAVALGRSAPPDQSWVGYAGKADSSRFFDSKQINRSNVATLEQVWTYPYGEAVFHPQVIRGVVYGRGRSGAIVALDAKTGKELWIHDGMTGMTTRGMN